MSAADSTDDRAVVLGRVRAALDLSSAGREGLALPPISHPSDVQEFGVQEFGVETFVERLTATGASLHAVQGEQEIHAAVAGILDQLDAQVIAVSDSPLAVSSAASFPGETLRDDAPKLDLFRADVGISAVDAAIAETGTLVLSTSAERNRLTSLVPDVHIAIVRRDQVVPSLDEALARYAQQPPRCVTFITGPSRTADIELELVVGVHGPMALHVILAD